MFNINNSNFISSFVDHLANSAGQLTLRYTPRDTSLAVVPAERVDRDVATETATAVKQLCQVLGKKIKTASLAELDEMMQCAFRVYRIAYTTRDTMMRSLGSAAVHRGIHNAVQKSSKIHGNIVNKALRILRRQDDIDAAAIDTAHFESGESLLGVAIGWGNSSLAFALIDQGVAIDRPNMNGRRPLDLATDPQIALRLIDEGVDVDVRDPITRESPLIKAVICGNLQVAISLIDAGADIDVQDNGGMTALMWACQNDYATEVVLRLIAAGAALNTKDAKGWTALMHACLFRREEIALKLLDVVWVNEHVVSSKGDSALSLACFGGLSRVVKRLIENGVSVNTIVVSEGDTPLIAACKRGFGEVAMQLIEAGALINIADKYSGTPLMYACQSGLDCAAIRLIEEGADIDACDRFKDTPLIKACWKKNTSVALRLIEEGADITAMNDYHETAFMYACKNNLIQVACELMRAGIDIQARNPFGKSMLLYAAAAGPELFEALLPVEAEQKLRMLAEVGSESLQLVEAAQSTIRYQEDENAVAAAVEACLETEKLCFQARQTVLCLLRKVTNVGILQRSLANPIASHPLVKQFIHGARLCLDFSVDLWHYQGRSVTLDIPAAPDTVALSSLIDWFDTTIGHLSHDERVRIFTQEFEVEPMRNALRRDIQVENRERSAEEVATATAEQLPAAYLTHLRSSLSLCIRNITDRIAIIGTPRQGTDALNAFYGTIERALKHTIRAINNKGATGEAQADKKRFLIDIVNASGHCGPRIQNTAISCYREMVQGIPQTFDNIIYQKIDEFRGKLVESALVPQTEESVVYYSEVVRKLGVEFGISGAEVAREASLDGIVSMGGSFLGERDRIRFFGRYTPGAIYEYIASDINQDSDLRDQCVAWCQRVLSSGWTNEVVDILKARFAEMQTQNKSSDEIHKALKDELPIQEGQRIEDALEQLRQQEYGMSIREVSDDGRVCIKAEVLRHILVRLKVLREGFSESIIPTGHELREVRVNPRSNSDSESDGYMSEHED